MSGSSYATTATDAVGRYLGTRTGTGTPVKHP